MNYKMNYQGQEGSNYPSFRLLCSELFEEMDIPPERNLQIFNAIYEKAFGKHADEELIKYFCLN
ncbi:MAG: hypothetical protein WCZ21_03910 [Bacteroidales bacterium]